MADTTLVTDVTTASFADDVIERSRSVPVVVDFWAGWCGPCRTLGPMLEAEVARRAGSVVLAKVDVDAEPTLAQQHRVQGIPRVIAYRDGVPVDEFTGVQPPDRLTAFFDGIAPSAADRAVAAARTLEPALAVAELELALEAAPGHRAAALALAELLVEDDPDRAAALALPHRPDPAAERVLARLEVARGAVDDLAALEARAAAGDDEDALIALGDALAAAGRHDDAAARLLAAVVIAGPRREDARSHLVRLLDLMDDPAAATEWRRRLARALF